MKVKRYTGGSLEKIREAIVKELGENAVIINIKKNSKNALLGLGKKQAAAYEVVAAVEESVDVDNMPAGSSSSPGEPPLAFKEFLEEQKNQYRGIRQSIKLLDDKLADVDDRMDKIAVDSKAQAFKDELKNVHDSWRSLVADAASKIAQDGTPDLEDIHEALASMLPTAGGILFRRTPSSVPDVYVLAGPTGVGKTTTLAKLAAKCVLGEKLNVGLITLDTFRVAAVDQLREYSSLLGVEVAVVFSGQELNQQLERFAEKDIVFVDTPGRSQFDETGIKAISECLKGVHGICVILVVTSNIRREDAESIYENYKPLKPSALILTKTDEATCCDGLTKLYDISSLPTLYLTDGQRVPEDIHIASPGIIASMIVPEVKSSEPIKIGDSRNGSKSN